jgi:hypothetical protein
MSGDRNWKDTLLNFNVIAVIALLLSVGTLSYTIYHNTPSTDFSVSVNDLKGIVAPGGSNSTTIFVDGHGAFYKNYDGGDVMLTVNPDNVSLLSFISLHLTQDIGHPSPTFKSQLNVIVANETPPGVYPLTITAKESSGLTHSCGYVLYVKKLGQLDSEFTYPLAGQSISRKSALNITGNVWSLPVGQHVWVVINSHDSRLWWLPSKQPVANGPISEDGTNFSVRSLNLTNMWNESTWRLKPKNLDCTIAAIAVNETVNKQYVDGSTPFVLLHKGDYEFLDAIVITVMNGESQ